MLSAPRPYARRWAFVAIAGSLAAANLVATAQPRAPRAREVAAAASVSQPEGDESPPEGPAPRVDLAEALRPEPGGLTAASAAQRAASVAPSVDRARATVREAEAGAERTWLGVIPRVDLSARYTRLSAVESGSIGQTVDPMVFDGERALADMVADPASRMLHHIAIAAQEQLAAGFSFPTLLNQIVFRASLTYPVSDLFLAVLPAHRAAVGFVEASRLQIRVAREQAALQAGEAFYNYARARSTLVVARITVADVEAHRTDVASFVEAGTAPRVELMRIDAQRAAAQVAVARVEGAAAIAAEGLRALLHLPPGSPITIGEDVTAPLDETIPSREAAMQRALESRPEAQALRRLARAREQSVAARRAAAYPHLAVAANAELSNPNQRVFPQQDEFRGTWDVSAILSWSPNSVFDANQDVSGAEATVAQARADLDALSDGIRIELAQAYEGLRSAEHAIESARVGITAAEESYRVRLERYRAGASVTSDVLDAESELTRARLDLVNSAIDLRVARMRLRRAMGEPLAR